MTINATKTVTEVTVPAVRYSLQMGKSDLLAAAAAYYPINEVVGKLFRGTPECRLVFEWNGTVLTISVTEVQA